MSLSFLVSSNVSDTPNDDKAYSRSDVAPEKERRGEGEGEKERRREGEKGEKERGQGREREREKRQRKVSSEMKIN